MFVKLQTENHLEFLSLKGRQQRLVRVYTCQNATLFRNLYALAQSLKCVYVFSIFASQGYEVHFVLYVRNDVNLVL